MLGHVQKVPLLTVYVIYRGGPWGPQIDWGAPGPWGTCLLGSFYLVASEMFVNGIDSSGSSQMLLHGDAQSFPDKVFHGIHEPISFITNIKSMAI